MKAFQLKITIKNSKPPIWRRVIVPTGITFSQLSIILNEVMGWSGSHLFEYEFKDLNAVIYEDDIFDSEDDCFEHHMANSMYISEYMEEGKWFTYTYGFGDCWEHKVTVEKIVEDYEGNYPQVIKYKGDCPFGDRGIYGYYDCLDIISDKDNPKYEEYMEWMESQGYPKKYNMDKVNQELREKFFYKWGKGEKGTQIEILEKIFSGKYGINATKNDKNKLGPDKCKFDDNLKVIEKVFEQSEAWCGATAEITLKEIFYDYNKKDIVEIAKDKGMKGVSGCRKNELIDRLTDYMLQPEEMKRYFLCLQDEEIDEFEKAAKAGSMYKTENLDLLLSLYQGSYIGMFNDGSIVVPNEVAEIYDSFKGDEFNKERERVSFVLDCLRAAGILYGIFPKKILKQLVNTDKKLNISDDEAEDILKNIPKEFFEYVIVDNKIYHKELYPDDRGLLSVQEGKEYYIPTKSEIIELGINGYLSGGKSAKKFRNYLIDRLGFVSDEADLFLRIIQVEIRSGCTMQDIINNTDDLGFEFESIAEMDEFVQHISDLWNGTRMLPNRGFTPHELVKEERRIPSVLESKNSKSNVISFEVAKRKKVYPNDLCPCGSGMKYKNCCKNIK